MRKLCGLFLVFLGFAPLKAQIIDGKEFTIKASLKKALHRYELFKEVGDSLIAVCSNGDWGYIDLNGNEVIPCIYDDAITFSEGIAKVAKKENTKTYFDVFEHVIYYYSYINKKGEVVIPTPYNDCGDFHNGRAFVKGENDKYGFINHMGDVVIPFIYNEVHDFSDGLAFVKQNGKWFYINTDGKQISKVFHNGYSACDYHDGLAAVANFVERVDPDNKILERDGTERWGFMNISGEVVIPQKYHSTYRFSDGYAVVEDNVSFAVIDKNNNMVFKKPKDYYSLPFDFDENYYVDIFVTKGRWAVGKIDESLSFDENYYRDIAFSEGLLVVGKTDESLSLELYGYVDVKGNVVIPFMYEKARPFHCGLAFVNLFCGDLGWRYGFVDKHGNNTFTEEEIRYFKNSKSKRRDDAAAQ